jgi:hypothetical protein
VAWRGLEGGVVGEGRETEDVSLNFCQADAVRWRR